jgi:hypothetical protein
MNPFPVLRKNFGEAKTNLMIKNLLFGLSITFIFSLCAEIFLRILLPFPMVASPTYEVSDTTDFFHKPNSMSYEISPFREFKPVKLEYNKYGFRGSYEKIPENKELIYILGDSYIESRQVPFKDTISEILNSQNINKFFINAGCSNFGVFNEYWLLKYNILNLNPKPSRIFEFFTYNDYTNDAKYYFGKNNFDINNLPQKSMHLKQPFKIEKWLELNSAVYANLKKLFEPFKLPTPENPESVVIGHPRRVNIADEDLHPIEKQMILNTHNALLEMNVLSNRNKIKMTVFIIPPPPQVSRDEWKFGKLYWGGGYQEQEWDSATFYQDRLMSFCHANKIECVDLLPKFKSETKKGRIYFDYDPHFTPNAQKVISDVISDYFKNEK